MAVNKKKPSMSKNRSTNCVSLNFIRKHDSATSSGMELNKDFIEPLERELTQLKLLEKPFESGEVNTSVCWLIQKLKEHHRQREESNNTLTELQSSYDELLLKYAEARNIIDQLKLNRTLVSSENEKLCTSQVCVADLSTQNECSNLSKSGHFVSTDKVFVSCPDLHALKNGFDKNSDLELYSQCFNFNLSNNELYRHDENKLLTLNKSESSHLVNGDKWDLLFGNKVGSKYSSDELFEEERYNQHVSETDDETVNSKVMENDHIHQLSLIQDLKDLIQSLETSPSSPTKENFLEPQYVKDETVECTRSDVQETSLENHHSKSTYSGETQWNNAQIKQKKKVCSCTCVNDRQDSLMHAKINLKKTLLLALRISTELEKQSSELLGAITNVIGMRPEKH
ncbi:uncharacterized protein LOC106465366 [Limulus polyphemus]|uniref:Uncharacterized protein LOC106465366 n=1 Tax=Limulus polyphemus TaxID=6850 RepID=A0ABM1SZ98_LIMPO|nr:uncharacterized protein LOC106465366 [Limulus polyphemus]XP_022248955.1 uncharacterized protein LOC106465366 [Limulus polyphemus]XP_022248956.1 uncharacterized protein LOC106465366 [Limulus polyphemus]XP_022248957.1 uncharacterized protein LOC106465366 [Limulus polyphemus]